MSPAYVGLLMSFFKDSVINFRGARARNFQQLNMGFAIGSSKQGRVAGGGWGSQSKRFEGLGLGTGTGKGAGDREKGHLPTACSVPSPQIRGC